MSERVHATPDRIPSYPEATYDRMDLNRLAVFTIGRLRDEAIPPSFENVTVAAFRMFPVKFALRGYDHPDSNRVNRTLLQLGPKYRNWAVGSPSTGFSLTALGETILVETRRVLAGDRPLGRGRGRTTGYTWDPTTEIEELKRKDAFRSFHESGPKSLDIDDVWEALGAFRYTPREAIQERLVALLAIAAQVDDREAISFLEALRKRFEKATAGGKKGSHA
jgi:hypothetical protein